MFTPEQTKAAASSAGSKNYIFCVQLLKNKVCHSMEYALETFSHVVTSLKHRSATDRKLGKALKQL